MSVDAVASRKTKPAKTVHRRKRSVLVSVIVPIYNAAPYLKECLGSVAAQTLKEIEVICIDDGSTDGSGDIANSQVKKDRRFRIVRQKNQGPGVARNAGLDVATGEYVLFLDADDRMVSGDALLQAYGQAKRDSLDILLTASSTIAEDGRILQTDVRINHELIPQEPVFAPDALGAALFSCTPMTPWGKLYRRAFLESNNLRFPALMRSEDFPLVELALSLSSRIGIFAQSLFEHRTGVASSLESTKDETPLIFFEAEQLLRDSLRKRKLWSRFKSAVYTVFVSRLAYNLRKVRSYSSFRAIIDKYCQECQQWICWEEVAMLERFADSLQLVEGIKCNMDEAYQIALFAKARGAKDSVQAMAAAQLAVCDVDQKDQGELLIGNRKFETEDAEKAKIELAADIKTNVKVSVVIPVYNVKGYLRQCLDSIVNQTLRDIEIICVDDGSTDNSIAILAEYAVKDPRVKVLLREHTNAGAARNAGMAAATGEYLGFVDSDDWCELTLFEKAYAKAKDENSDMVFWGYCDRDETTGKIVRNRPVTLPVGVRSPFAGSSLGDKVFSTFGFAPWNRIVRRDLVLGNGLGFQQIERSNDVAFGCMAIAVASRISTVDEVLYNYRVRSEGNLQSGNGRTPLSIVEAWKFLVSELSRLGLLEKNRAGVALASMYSFSRTLGVLTGSEGEYKALFDALRRLFSEDVFFLRLSTSGKLATTSWPGLSRRFARRRHFRCFPFGKLRIWADGWQNSTEIERLHERS